MEIHIYTFNVLIKLKYLSHTKEMSISSKLFLILSGDICDSR